MNTKLLCSFALLSIACVSTGMGQGPYPATNWPTSINPSKMVHYLIVNDTRFTVPNGNWTPSLGIVAFNTANSGDQGNSTQDVCDPRGFTLTADKATQTFLNVYDTAFQQWNTLPQVDILMEVYGDTSVLNPSNPSQIRNWQFREGTTGASAYESGNSINMGTTAYTTAANNNKWNWILFTLTNKVWLFTNVDLSITTNRYIGSVPPGSAGTTTYGGVNGGTIRVSSTASSGLVGVPIHAIAFGEPGAFGVTNDVNQFEAPATTACDPVPVSNLAGIDFNASVTNYLQIVTNDNTVSYSSSIGSVSDLRKAVIPDGPYLNFGIISNYLGEPCNPNVIVKICVDFYDDPSQAGASFGPESYAADATGCNPNTAVPLSSLYMLQGAGRWVHKSWTLSGVNLRGVNTAPLTGGVRFISLGAQVAVSRFYMGVLRITGPLAGQDPLADCYVDPNICNGVYGDYAELDLTDTNNPISNGIGLGGNSGDQTYIIEQAGPVGDLRGSVRGSAGPSYFLNFAILTNALGPAFEGNVTLAIAVTYYDDPSLVGKAFRAQTWTYNGAGSLLQGFLNGPPNPGNMVLQGTGRWRDAYWQINQLSFDGINQHPAAARFEMDDPGIHINRIRYAVIRPCGQNAGINQLAGLKVNMAAAPDTNSLIRLSWPYRASQAQLQSAGALNGAWTNVLAAPAVEGGEQTVLRVTNTPNVQFFRLIIPPVP